MARRELTAKEEKWLRENYPIKTLKDCGKKLGMSAYAVRCWAQRLKIADGTKHPIRTYTPVQAKPKVKKPVEPISYEYCIDCEHYGLGGWCVKFAKITGALNNKPCFTKK